MSFWRLHVQAADPATPPSAGQARLYAKGTSLFLQLDSGTVVNLGAPPNFDRVVLPAIKSVAGPDIDPGTPVYVTGYDDGNAALLVEAADASNSVKMPAVGIVKQAVSTVMGGEIILVGELTNLVTDTFPVGSSLYVANGGGLVNVPPSGPSEAQHVGVVLKSHATLGIILVGIDAVNSLSDLDPQSVGAVNSGTSPVASRSDHVHAHGNQAGGSLHADAIAGGADGFMTGADKTKLDGIEAGAEVNDVDTVFGRVGAVVAATSDYDASQVDNDSGVAGAFVSDALNTLNSGKLSTAHEGAGGAVHADVVAGGADGFMTGADKTKLDGIEAGAEVNEPFGEDYQHEVTPGPLSTTSSTYQTAEQLVTPALTGTYRVAFTCSLGNVDRAGNVRLYNVTDAAEINTALSIRQKTADAENSLHQFGLVVFTGASKTFEVQYRDIAGGNTQTIKNIHMELYRVS
jgi:hypothetical protein